MDNQGSPDSKENQGSQANQDSLAKMDYQVYLARKEIVEFQVYPAHRVQLGQKDQEEFQA